MLGPNVVDFPVKQTSGFFSLSSVINDPTPTANPLTLQLFVSNFSSLVQTAAYWLYSLIDNGKDLLQSGLITVPANGAGMVEINAGNFPGQTLEVVFGFTDPAQKLVVAPSLMIFETFIADGATRPIFYVATGAFASLGTAVGGSFASLASPIAVTITNGLFDVPQGVAATLPKVNIVLDNATTQEQLATVTINSVPFGGTTKQVSFSQLVAVPPGQPLLIPIDAGSTGIEGLPSEIVLTLPLNSRLELLVEPSVNVTQYFTSDNTFEELLFIGPTAFGLVQTVGEQAKVPFGALQLLGRDAMAEGVSPSLQGGGRPIQGRPRRALPLAIPIAMALLAVIALPSGARNCLLKAE